MLLVATNPAYATGLGVAGANALVLAFMELLRRIPRRADVVVFPLPVQVRYGHPHPNVAFHSTRIPYGMGAHPWRFADDRAIVLRRGFEAAERTPPGQVHRSRPELAQRSVHFRGADLSPKRGWLLTSGQSTTRRPRFVRREVCRRRLKARPRDTDLYLCLQCKWVFESAGGATPLRGWVVGVAPNESGLTGGWGRHWLGCRCSGWTKARAASRAIDRWCITALSSMIPSPQG